MKIRLKLGALAAALLCALTTAHAAINVLYVANTNDASYQAYVEARYPGSVWVHKTTGLAGDTIGGDLDRVEPAFAGAISGANISVRAYMQSFDLVVVGVPTSSGNFIDGSLGADWAALTKPVLFHSSFAVRSLDGRTGMFAGSGAVTITLASPADSVRVATTPLSDTLLAGVASVTDLYAVAQPQADTITGTLSAGAGQRITSVTTGSVQHFGLVYWSAGATNGAGHTLASHRAFIPLKGAVTNDLNTDGRIVLGNVIDQLLVPVGGPVVTAPSGLVATSGSGQVSLSWTGTAEAVSYNVKRSTASGSAHTTISAAGAVTGTTYTDTTVANGVTYHYVVSAVTGSGTESADSAEASAAALQPAKKILYVANSNSAAYQTFATSGQFSQHTWTVKPTGAGGDDTIGGDLSRVASFTGPVNAANDITVKAYLESFDLVIIGVPTTSANFVDTVLGAAWAGVATPILVHSSSVARATGGRVGLFSGDNFITLDLGAVADTTRVSTSALADALFAGVTEATNLYSLNQADTINALASPGNGELVTRLTNGTATHLGLTFWPAGAYTGANSALAANRAFLPFKGGFADLTADGQKVLANLLNEILQPQTPAPLLAPTNLVATENAGAVDLAWGFGYGATSYTIRRSVTSGSGYVVLSAGTVVGNTFTDATAAAGATYFYLVTAVNSTASADSAEATVTLAAPVGGLTAWRQTKLGSAENTGDAADSADPDFDGRANLLEYATGTEPLVADAGPVVALDQTAGKLTLTFTRIADPALTYVVRGSSDLAAAWNETPVFTSTGAANVAEIVNATDTVAVSAQPRRFLRLEIAY